MPTGSCPRSPVTRSAPSSPKTSSARIHPVADLGFADFIPPQTAQLVRERELGDRALRLAGRGGAAKPCGAFEELMEFVRALVNPATWEEGATINAQGRDLIVRAPPEAQNPVAASDDLRAFAGIVVTVALGGSPSTGFAESLMSSLTRRERDHGRHR